MKPLQIYISRSGQQTGPYSLEEIRSHLASGALVPNDLAWHEGASDWGRLGLVPGVAVPPRIEHVPLATHVEEPTNRLWLVLGGIGSALLSVVILLITLMSLIDSGTGPLLFGLLMTALGICASVQFFVALRRHSSGCCELCRRPAPTIRVSLNRHIGALILMFHKSLSGSFCKSCISTACRDYTLTTLFLGWWGLISFFITPIVLINNVMVYVRSRFMKPS